MIQFNLLPDVKIAYIKAQRQKQIVMTISTIASIAAIVIFVLLFMFVHVAQNKSINDLSRDIKNDSEELLGTKDLNKILTIQNQLGALEELHNDKVSSSRLFKYIEQVTPAKVSISLLNIDYAANTMEISGAAPTLADVNIYADSLKFTKFSTESDKETKNAFSNVVLSNFTVSPKTGAEYSFTVSFDPMLFNQSEVVALVVPKMVTSRSAVERPSAIFQPLEEVQ